MVCSWAQFLSYFDKVFYTEFIQFFKAMKSSVNANGLQFFKSRIFA